MKAANERMALDERAFDAYCIKTNTKPTKKLLRMWWAAIEWERTEGDSAHKLKLLENIIND